MTAQLDTAVWGQAGPQAPRCLVTGAGGFLGRELSRRLAAAGYRVLGVGRSAPVEPVIGVEHFETLDLARSPIGNLLRDWKPAVCIQAAGVGGAPDSELPSAADEPPDLAICNNIFEGIASVSPQCRVILLSSAAVYGQPQRNPVSESNPLVPISAYGRRKQACEMVGMRYADQHGLDVRIARVFNAYGPGQCRQLFWDICRQAECADDGQLELFGDGCDERDFVHVRDVSEAVLRVATASKTDRRCWNLGTGQPTPILEVAKQVTKLWPSSITIRFTGQHRLGGTSRIWADIASLRELGFEPQVSLREGFEQFVRWFLTRQSISVPA